MTVTVIAAQAKTLLLLFEPEQMLGDELENHLTTLYSIKHISFTGLYWVVAISMYQLGLAIEMNTRAIEMTPRRKTRLMYGTILICFILYAVFLCLNIVGDKLRVVVLSTAVVLTTISSILISNFLRRRVNQMTYKADF